MLIQPVRQPPDRVTAVPQPRHRSRSRTEILVYNPWPDRSRKLLITVSSAIAILALFLALKSYGATELLAQYRTFLLMLTAAGLGVWVMPRKLLQDRRFQVFLLIGAFLLFQSWWLNTLEARGYILLSLGWVTAFLILALSWQNATAIRLISIFLILAGSLEALYGLVQSLGGVDYIGSYQRDVGSLATGTFINPNHFAGFLNMVIPFAMGALVAGFTIRRRRRPYTHSEAYAWGWIILLACAFMGLAVLLSQSRGGAVSLAASLLLMGILLFLKKRRGGALSGWSISILIALTIGLSAWVGVNTLLERFGQVEVDLPTRLRVYQATVEMVSDYPLFGVGPGMFGWRFRPYQTGRSDTLFLHTHNDYLQTVAEWGIPAALVFWIFVLWRLRGAIRTSLVSLDPWTQGIALGCAGAMAALLLHSLVDFNLQIPANWMIFSLILALSWVIEVYEASFEPGMRRV
ncbi:MAG TPA: O-antigen ligase family protein [Acidobacteriota bacterium]|nr:O-antigen ligase family protein [Acidobacteriota bacterium]